MGDWALSQFDQRGIAHQLLRLEKVDPLRKRAFTADGEEHPFDVLVAVPAHRGAPVVADSGLGDERGFVPTDRLTLKMEGDDRVYVLGDATNLPLPKGGSAYYQSEVLVQNLVSRLKGLPETSVYDGKGAIFCDGSKACSGRCTGCMSARSCEGARKWETSLGKETGKGAVLKSITPEMVEGLVERGAAALELLDDILQPETLTLLRRMPRRERKKCTGSCSLVKPFPERDR